MELSFEHFSTINFEYFIEKASWRIENAISKLEKIWKIEFEYFSSCRNIQNSIENLNALIEFSNYVQTISSKLTQAKILINIFHNFSKSSS